MSKDLIKLLLMPFVATIKRGPLKGNKWIIASGSRLIQGKYEPDTVEIISAKLVNGNSNYSAYFQSHYIFSSEGISAAPSNASLNALKT